MSISVNKPIRDKYLKHDTAKRVYVASLGSTLYLFLREIHVFWSSPANCTRVVGKLRVGVRLPDNIRDTEICKARRSIGSNEDIVLQSYLKDHWWTTGVTLTLVRLQCITFLSCTVHVPMSYVGHKRSRSLLTVLEPLGNLSELLRTQ